MKIILVYVGTDGGSISEQMLLTKPFRYSQHLLRVNLARHEGLDDVVTLGSICFSITALAGHPILEGVIAAVGVTGREESVVRLIAIET